MWLPTEEARDVHPCSKGTSFDKSNIVGRPHLNLEDLDFDLDDRDCDSVSSKALKVPCKEKVRHVLFSIRLRKAYVVYCFCCFLMACLACVSTFFRLANLKSKGQTVWSHRWQTWETVLEAIIGVAVCSETLCALWLAGCSSFLSDFWSVFDTFVVAVTLLHLALLALQWAWAAHDVLKVDLVVLAIRFALQPCRLLSTASMLRRVRRMQQNTVDLAFDVLENVSEGSPTPLQSRILTMPLQEAISEHLPSRCRGTTWSLIHAAGLRGESSAAAMEAFYRCQQQNRAAIPEGGGANVILVRTSLGRILGGFSLEAWHPCDGTWSGYRSTDKGFVFSVSSAFCVDAVGARDEASSDESVRFYHATREGPEVLQRSDWHEVAIGDALTLRDGFQTVSTRPCAMFASPALIFSEGQSEEEQHFAVQCFECWRVGGSGLM